MPFRAEDGTLTMMFGGSSGTFVDLKPTLDIMGEFVVHCGEVGMGQLMKAVNNIIYNVNIAAFCEVMPLVDAMVATYEAAMDMGLGGEPKSAMI